MTKTVTPWQRTAALIIELQMPLSLLMLCFGELMWRSVMSSDDRMLLVLTAGFIILSAPARLGRIGWYRLLIKEPSAAGQPRAFFAGWRHWAAAIGWQWQRWWRLTAAFLIACIPAAAVWGLGDRLGRRSGDTVLPFLCLLVGGLLFVLATGGVAVWSLRYALAPLFVWDGCPASAAMQLSARQMRHHRCAYIEFCGSWLWRLSLCLLLIPVPWVLPDFHREQTAFLLDIYENGKQFR